MTTPFFALFDTPIGHCGIAWGPEGITGLQLPDAGPRATRARLRARFPAATEAEPPAAVARVVDAIGRLLAGEKVDLSTVTLDMDGVPPFHRRVYEAARAIAPGTTLSYGEIAARLGMPGAARAVGQALGRNPFPIVVPCHRVLAAGNKAGGFTATGGVDTKLRMLALEGAARPAAREPRLFDGNAGLGFDWRTAVAHLKAADPKLGRVIDAAGPANALVLKNTPSVFGALAEAIVHQQLSGKAAATIYGRVCALFPRAPHGPTAEHVHRTAEERLRGAGLSAAKVAALKDLARRERAGEIPTLAEARAMDDAAIVERLIAVRGIGRWTAEMLLIFRLGRPDVLPVDDYGVRKGFALAHGKRELPTPRALAKHGERWRPYRTVASWYCWRALDL
ncbi:MAG: methylated-DNA--[protein]-cysteine S-methyltransferase [Deltaproteobacteria bacterium]|nr:methylated-DNA--[protein]-cysteine S-methyltransferase [Deltaproteobacteria bacterium]